MQLILIRGFPGSGKSTLATLLSNLCDVEGDSSWGTSHYEADMFFMKNGNYHFDQDRLHEAHLWCQAQTDAALANGYSVVVSNTFSMLWEMRPYIKMAKEHGAQLTVLMCEGQYGNTHNVPDEVIQKMKARWQPYVND